MAVVAVLLMVAIYLSVVVVEIHSSTKDKTYDIKEITILDGSKYDLLLEDGRRIKAILVDGNGVPIEVSPKARYDIELLFRMVESPKVATYSKKNGVWLVNIYAKHNKEDICLSELLKRAKYIYE